MIRFCLGSTGCEDARDCFVGGEGEGGCLFQLFNFGFEFFLAIESLMLYYIHTLYRVLVTASATVAAALGQQRLDAPEK